MATFIVDQNGDDAAAESAGTTLREAIAEADASGGADTILFDPTVFTGGAANTIHLVQGELLVDTDVTINGDIDGDDIADVTVSGDALQDDATRLDGLGNTITDVVGNTNDTDNSRVFAIVGTAEVALNGLIITGGRISGAVDGAGVLVDDRAELLFTNGSISGNKAATNTRDGGGLLNDGKVELVNSDVSFNSADNGAGIRNRGELIAENTTITNNIAEDQGGGLFTSGGQFFFGGRLNEGYATLTNVTIADNIVTDRNGTGGGIQAYDRNLFDVTRTGNVELIHTTITGNSATGAGGGISLQEATVFAYNSIILGNGATTNAEVNIVPGTLPVFYDGGGNILTGDPGQVFDQTIVRAGGDGLLGTADDAQGGVLANNGGPFQSVALRNSDTNPALDVGLGLDIDTDATGAPRAIDRPGVDNGGIVDAGALELQQGTVAAPEALNSFVVNTNAGFDQFDGLTSLVEAIALAESDPDPNTITFDPTVFTGGAANIIRLSETLEFDTTVTIDGDLNNDGVADIVLSGDRAGDDVSTTTRTGLTITDVLNSPSFTRFDVTETRLKDNVQILSVNSGADVSLNGLVLTGGADLEVFNTVKFGVGGAGYVGGTLSISNSTVAGNIANREGGAFLNAGSLSLTDTTLSNNLAPSGGAISNADGTLRTERVTFADNLAQTESGTGTPRGGGLYNDGRATLINTTFFGNRAAGQFGEGGAIHHEGPASSFDDQTLDLLNVTITGNTSADEGGGVFLDRGPVTITNTIILGNDAATDSEISVTGIGNPIINAGGNIFAGDVSQIFYQTEATVGADGIAGNGDDGLTGRLGDNGGRVQTVALENSNSNPALDVSDIFTLNADDSDANLDPRAVDRAGVDNGGVLDAGAVELQQGTVVPVGATGSLVVNSADDGNLFDGLTSISEALALANSDPDQSTITFDPTVFTGGAANIIHLAQGLEITTDIIIDGDLDNDGRPDIVLSGDVNGDDATTTDANGTTITDAENNLNTSDNVRVMRITNDAAVTLDGVTVTGGFLNSNGAGILAFPDTMLTLTNSSVSGNRTLINGDGAGIFAGVRSALDITNSLISQNYAGTFGGGIYALGTTTISDSTIAENGARVGGGGLYVGDGAAFVTNSTFSGNDTGRGGGIQVIGDLVASGITVSGNTAGVGAGIGVGTNGSSFTLSGTALVQNSTIANNVASSPSGNGIGGGVLADVGTTTLINTTVTGNAAGTSGGGVAVGIGRAELQNSIVLGNSAGTGPNVEDDEDIVDNLGNIFGGDAALVFETTATNAGADGLVGTADDVLAGQLADNGAPVQTVSLRNADDNPAIDLGVFTLSDETLDVFGNPRFIDRQTGSATGVIDAGAEEVQDGIEVFVETPAFVVNTQGDANSFDGLTSLREAIALANADPDQNTITFDPTVFTGGAANVINLTFGDLKISSALTIEGDLDGDDLPDIVVSADALGDDMTTIGPNGAIVTDLNNNTNTTDNANRVFTFTEGSDATVNGIVVTGGNVSRGGGVLFEFGSKGTFQNSAIVGNEATSGGGLYNSSDATRLTNVEIAGNYAAFSGGGVGNGRNDQLLAVNVSVVDNTSNRTGGGIFNYGRLDLVNTTIANNETLFTFGRGGAIQNQGTLDIKNSTITGNSTDFEGGGINNFGFDLPVSIQNSIVLGNSDADGNVQVTESFSDFGGNIIGGDAAQVFASTVALPGVDGALNTADDVIAGQSANNGGLLTTVALLNSDGNPALDVSNSFPGSLTPTDATGQSRAVDRAAVDNGGVIDAGALELQSGTSVPFGADPGLVVDTLSDVFDPFDGVTSIREALQLANGNADATEVFFDPTVFIPGQDNVIHLTQGTLVVVQDLIMNGDLDGDDLPDVTISGDALSDDAMTTDNVGAAITDVFNNTNTADNVQVLNVLNTADLTLNGFTLTGGHTDQRGGGLNAFYGTSLLLTNSSISGNYAERAAGGLNNNGVATIFNTAFVGNSTAGDGGGLATRGSSGSDNNGTFFGANLTITQNYAADGAGGIVSGEAGLLIASSVVGNTSGNDGGGAEADFFDPFTIVNSTISGNTSADEGGGIFGQSSSEIILQNTIILGNASTSGEEIERSGGQTGLTAFTDQGGNLISGDGAAVFANTLVLDGPDRTAGTSDDAVSGALDATGRLFQSVSLRDDTSNPARGITPVAVVLDETQVRLDLNDDGDMDDTAVTLNFTEIGASSNALISAFAGTGPTDPPPDDGGPTDPPPDDGGPTDPPPDDGGPTDPPPDDGGPTDPPPGDGEPTDPPPGDGGPDQPTPSDGDQTFVFSQLMQIQGGDGSDTVDFSGLEEDELPGAFNGVIVDLDLTSDGESGTPGQDGAILEDVPQKGGAPVSNGGLVDIENVIGSNFDDGIFGNNEVNVLRGGEGDDIIAGFAGDDILSGGLGADEFQGRTAELDGDTITDFDVLDQIRVLSEAFGTSAVTFEKESGTVFIDVDDDGQADIEFTLSGDFDTLTLAAVSIDTDVLLSLAPIFTEVFQLQEGVALDASDINGIFNQALLTGDGAKSFDVKIADFAAAGFDNALGVYEVNESGDIVDTQILVNDVKAAVGTSVIVDDVEDGHSLGFFIIQNGADFAGSLTSGAMLSFVDGAGNPANISSSALRLAVDGSVSDASVFHSFDASLNIDGQAHAISGIHPDGTMTIGFEDLIGLGDSDFQDVVFTVTMRDGIDL